MLKLLIDYKGTISQKKYLGVSKRCTQFKPNDSIYRRAVYSYIRKMQRKEYKLFGKLCCSSCYGNKKKLKKIKLHTGAKAIKKIYSIMETVKEGGDAKVQG